MTTKMLTEMEVAEALRCSASKVKRLRLSGRLAYLPGRPVLVREEDLAAYLESVRRPARTVEDGAPLKSFLLETEAAERLRCTTKRIKELRQSGKLKYMPGPPVVIDEADLERYIAEEMRNDHSSEEIAQKAREEWAREQVHKIRLKRRLWEKSRQRGENS
jgi:excisionase family DNA binding protein